MSKADQMKERMEEFLANGIKSNEDPFGTLLRLSLQKTLQTALEQERTEFLDREYYGHRDDTSVRGRRSGYKPGRVNTAEGAVALWKPQVRDTVEPFQPQLLEYFARNSLALVRLVIETYARGLSTRDVEATFQDPSGRALLSRTGTSRITEELWKEYQAFSARDLSKFDLVYFFIDAVYESMREKAGLKEGLLCAWGILRNGKKVLLHLALGNKESYGCCLEFVRGMVRRGLKIPISTTTDGAPGLIKAINESFPRSLRLRCWFHLTANVLDKVPDGARADVKAHLIAVRDAPTFEAGEARAEEFVHTYGRSFPSAVECFQDDLPAKLNHLKLPAEHRKRVRTTNLLERGFGEQKRRTKVIPRFFNEKACIKLVFAVLWRASQSWRGIRMSANDLELIDQLAARLGIHEPKGQFRPALKSSQTNSAMSQHVQKHQTENKKPVVAKVSRLQLAEK